MSAIRPGPAPAVQSLSIHDLTLQRGGRPVLDGIGLSLHPGEVSVIIGPNGAGKSTLIAALAGLLSPHSGQVRLDGGLLSDMERRARARRIALLPQHTDIAWPITVRSLVELGRIPHQGAFGLRAADADAVDRALRAAQVTDFADRPVADLSGGERARVLIARALAGEADWLLADEPLAGLDPGHALDALSLFRAEADRGAGVVLTLHDLDLAARMADRIVVLADGRIAADGSAATALTPELLQRVYGIRTQVTVTADRVRIDILGRQDPQP
jgi:iron complex transport system ATP-binding protein